MAWNRPTNRDFLRMPQRALAASNTPQVALVPLLRDTGTTALLVLHAGQLVWEHDANDASRERPNRCFSVTTSIASALVGIAIAEGAIESVDQPIGRLGSMSTSRPTRKRRIAEAVAGVGSAP